MHNQDILHIDSHLAGIAQLVEHKLPKLGVASSNLVSRSISSIGYTKRASVLSVCRVISSPYLKKPIMKNCLSKELHLFFRFLSFGERIRKHLTENAITQRQQSVVPSNHLILYRQLQRQQGAD